MSPKVLLVLAGVALARPATALQPLQDFLRGARARAPDNLEARAARGEAGAQADAALGRALPRLSLRAEYVRNQFETVLQLPGPSGGPGTPVTVVPRDQRDGTAALEVPLVDPGTFGRIGAARTGAAAAATRAVSTDLQVQSIVTRDYHQLVAAVALVVAARHAREVAEAGLRMAEERFRVGANASLDVDRARADVERNVQQLASAELQVSLVARALESLAGIAPELAGEVPPPDDLHDEPPLEAFQPPDEKLPAVAAAIQDRRASEQEARARRLALLPALGGIVSERDTSAPGLAGHEAAWQGVLALTWSFDLTTLAGIRAQDSAADGARAREQRARLAARDEIHRTWQTVRTDIARSRSARVEAEVSARAADVALQRYRAGAAAQLDLLQAQRDAFEAAAARIQADAELADSRAQLRIAAGESLLEPGPGRTP